MTTNLIATITVLLSTNAVEHWPQKLVGMVPNPDYAAWAANKHTHPYTLEYCAPEIQLCGDDTNADTKSVETTVTRQRVLNVREGQWVEIEKVNGQWPDPTGLKIRDWITTHPQMWVESTYSFVLTNEPVAHYSVDYVRVMTNEWRWMIPRADGTIEPDNGRKVRILPPDNLWDWNLPQALTPTNWFIPMSTNWIK